jgi:hypothetical protein
MAIYTPEEIEQFRQRWKGKDALIEDVIHVLKSNEKATEVEEEVAEVEEIEKVEEIERRMRAANDILSRAGFPLVGNEIAVWTMLQPLIIPDIDLRGIPFKVKDLRHIFLSAAHLEGADLWWAHLEGADLWHAHLQGADLKGAHLESAYLGWVHLEGANLEEAHLEGADLSFAHLEGANLRKAHLEGTDIGAAHLESTDFSSATVGSLKDYRFCPECKLPKEKKVELKHAGKATHFGHNAFLPRWLDHFKSHIHWRNLFEHIFSRWFYTKFEGVRIDDADTVMAPDLYRYVKDQQYLYRFKETHPWIYRLWKILSDCGGKLSVVAFWSAVFVLLFSWLYPATNSIKPDTLGAITEKLPHFWQWIFISVSIFSNLGIPNIQFLRPLGVVLIISECVLGLMMLGMLISVLQNRFARRS